jgi:hypothetical protein
LAGLRHVVAESGALERVRLCTLGCPEGGLQL